jgi:hypothetical protein
MSTPYDAAYTPPAPVLHIRLSAASESLRTDTLTAIVDTGSDATLIPSRYLETIEAIDLGDAVLRSVLGEARGVHLFELEGITASTAPLAVREKPSKKYRT